MNRVLNGSRTLARIVLLASLLAAQGTAFAHDLEHLALHGESLCAVCSASHVQDAMTPESGACELQRPARDPLPDSAPAPRFRVPAHTFHARAPPRPL